MKICGIYSMDEARAKLAAEELKDCWLVSIMDLADDFIVKGPCKGILRIRFDDIETHWVGRKLANKDDIRRILEWCRTKKSIVVHCYSGVSRSSAIAYLIECLEQPPEKALEILNADKHSPNSHIIRIGARVFNDREILTCFMGWMEDNGRMATESADC